MQRFKLIKSPKEENEEIIASFDFDSERQRQAVAQKWNKFSFL